LQFDQSLKKMDLVYQLCMLRRLEGFQMNHPLSVASPWGARTYIAHCTVCAMVQWCWVWISTNTCKCTLAIMGEKEQAKKQVTGNDSVAY